MEIKKYINEIWKNIPGYEGLYQVSTSGRIKSLKRYRTTKSGGVCEVKERILSSRVCNKYYYITLHKNGVMTTYQVHTLVAKTFIPNPLNYPCVNHKDENKLNNSVENLEWCTSKYNANYGTRNEKISKSKFKKIAQCDLNGNILYIFYSIKDAALSINKSYRTISNCCRGRQKTAYGYIWKFIS